MLRSSREPHVSVHTRASPVLSQTLNEKLDAGSPHQARIPYMLWGPQAQSQYFSLAGFLGDTTAVVIVLIKLLRPTDPGRFPVSRGLWFHRLRS